MPGLPGLPGLPEGIFAFKKYQFEYILDGLGIENVGIFYGHLVYIMATWYILWPLGIYYGIYFVIIWYVFSRFGIFHQ
jgi:hypothetical protein